MAFGFVKTIAAFLLTIAGFALVWAGIDAYLPVLPPFIAIGLGILVLFLAAYVVGKRKPSLL